MIVDLIFYIAVLWPLIAPLLWLLFSILSYFMITEARPE